MRALDILFLCFVNFHSLVTQKMQYLGLDITPYSIIATKNRQVYRSMVNYNISYGDIYHTTTSLYHHVDYSLANFPLIEDDVWKIFYQRHTPDKSEPQYVGSIMLIALQMRRYNIRYVQALHTSISKVYKHIDHHKWIRTLLFDWERFLNFMKMISFASNNYAHTNNFLVKPHEIKDQTYEDVLRYSSELKQNHMRFAKNSMGWIATVIPNLYALSSSMIPKLMIRKIIQHWLDLTTDELWLNQIKSPINCLVYLHRKTERIVVDKITRSVFHENGISLYYLGAINVERYKIGNQGVEATKNIINFFLSKTFDKQYVQLREAFNSCLMVPLPESKITKKDLIYVISILQASLIVNNETGTMTNIDLLQLLYDKNIQTFT
ncbi:hypothetical protein SNEBB_009938 [Seison nebaliae]|nr:hypothetical protein SNEBB_009938 [Seison nebaliae]